MDSGNKVVKKAVYAVAEAGLQSSSHICQIDHRCPQGNHKSLYSLHSYSRIERGETSKKKAWKKKKRQYRQEKAQKDSPLLIDVPNSEKT